MPRLDTFAEYIQDSMESWNCPGVAVAIVQGDDVLHQSVHGVRDVENQLPMTEDTRFAMASVTKSFTAVSAALLVDQGVLAWDKPVREYIPEFILNDTYVTEHITVRDMLSHRTGLPRHDLSAWRLDISRAEFIKRMKHFKFSASFREKFQYNNLMYYATAYLEIFDFWIKIRFLVNDNGEVETVAIPIEPEVDDVIFTRSFPRLTDDTLAGLVGEYNTPIDGVAISITAHKDKIYASFTGEAPEEIKLYRFDSELIGFRMKRNRLDFVRQNGTITRLIFKAPDITLEAPKKQ
jgi:Beta-lactamase